MPSLPHNSHPDAGSLRTYLESVLPDARLTLTTADSAYQPLLLLETRHVMAAFGFSNGELQRSYEALYGKFKSYYAEQHGQWDALDLAFVFCVQPDVPHLDHFCSHVETDVYFCRKFVVPLTSPVGMSLARLPFLPLTPLHGKSLRPPSAQTFLQQCGVPAVLAKFLVVQHERGPERIVEDCTTAKFGEPQVLTSVANAPIMQSDSAVVPIRLETVAIKNFRAYRKPQTFVIGADVTVLYGPNGFGKTSFFDAVDFAVTGGIARLETSNEAHFAKTAQHLDSNSEESVVSLSFQCNSGERKVTRSVNDRKQALLDGQPTDRKTLLMELTSGDMPITDRVENFVNLFRATHLFSQEQQELTKDFRDDCRLSAQIVSKMLAVEDYANAVNKATKVRQVLQTAIADANTQIRELSDQIVEDKKEFDRLSQATKAQTDPEALDVEIEALRRKMIGAGIAVESQRPDVAAVRSWRASLEARHGESQSQRGRLSDLAKEVAILPGIRNEIASLQQQLAQKEQAIGTAEEKRGAAELAVQRAEQTLAEMSGKCTEAQDRSVLLEWVRTTKPVYVQLIEKQRAIKEELKLTTDTLVQHRLVEEQAVGNLRAQEIRASEAAEKLKTKQQEAQARSVLLEWVRTTKPVYVQLIEKQRAIKEELKCATDALAQHRGAEEQAVGNLRTQENGASEAAEKLKAKREESVTLQSLNESIAPWQTNRTRLAAVVESERAALKSLESLRDEERDLSPQVIRLAAEEARVSRQIAEVDKNQSELKTLLSQLQGHVRTGTCPLCGEDHGSADELVRRIQRNVTTDAASGARIELTNVREQAKQLAERVAENKQKQEMCGTQLASLKSERVRLDAEIGQFENSTAQLGIVIEESGPTPAEQVQTRYNRLEREIGELNRQVQEAKVAVDAARTVLADIKNLVAGEAAKVTDRNATLGRLEEEANRLRDDPRLTQISLDVEPDQLAEVKRIRFEQEIGELNQQVQEAGVAVDTARTVLASVKNLVAAEATKVTDRNATLARLQEEANRLRDDPRLTQISLDIDPEQLAEAERLNLDHLTVFKANAANAQTEAAQKKPEVSALRQESASLKAQIAALRTQLTNLQNTVTQISARLEESELPLDTTEEKLLTLIAEESRAQAHFLALRDSASNLELAIDAATTAAALTRLQQNVRNKEKTVASAARKMDQHQPWLKYFDELSQLVSSQQHEAIADFTREYGPRTSVIQRRLRSVYGFDDIEIRSHESTISVRVKRHGEELRPTDYFSQSQQQTLLLALFLTACISQTWSAFSPVFLDDPVTHFDDLNTYAFLDLIVGLLESDSGRRQFVISTCDEKLLQLARQKFRHLGERAIFYRFSAIGPDGPSVEKVTP